MTLDRLTIQLPWPDSRLMPNRKHGKHWAATQAVKIKARQDGYMAARQALGKGTLAFTGRVAMRLTFAAPDKRRRDLDNLHASCKASLDGIAQALGIDDSRFRPVTLDDAQDTEGRGFVLVEIGT